MSSNNPKVELKALPYYSVFNEQTHKSFVWKTFGKANRKHTLKV